MPSTVEWVSMPASLGGGPGLFRGRSGAAPGWSQRPNPRPPRPQLTSLQQDTTCTLTMHCKQPAYASVITTSTEPYPPCGPCSPSLSRTIPRTLPLCHPPTATQACAVCMLHSSAPAPPPMLGPGCKPRTPGCGCSPWQVTRKAQV